MDCRTVRRYLAMYLDSELGPETTFEISSHLEECADCRRVADQEGYLENRLRSALRAPRSEDEAIWERSVARFKHSRAGIRTHIVGIGIAGLTIAATLALYVMFGTPWMHDELDLAEATAAEHTLALNLEGLGPDKVRDAGKLDTFFRKELSPAYCMNLDTSEGMRIIEAEICELSNVPTAHVVCADSLAFISMFWLPSEAIAAFPEAIERFRKDGSSFHCHVDPYEFFAIKSSTGVIVGIAKTTPAILEARVGRAAMGTCQGEI